MLTVDFDRLDLRPGMRGLDAGCGTGRHICEAFRRADVTAVGLDRTRTTSARPGARSGS